MDLHQIKHKKYSHDQVVTRKIHWHGRLAIKEFINKTWNDLMTRYPSDNLMELFKESFVFTVMDKQNRITNDLILYAKQKVFTLSVSVEVLESLIIEK
jgi:hypothetical protein